MLTELLRRWSGGDREAFDRLIHRAYPRLHRIAGRQTRRESTGHTLQPTAVLHEAILRLMVLEGSRWADRGHFYAVATEMMRRILIDHARRKRRLKRGGDDQRVSLAEAATQASESRSSETEALAAALGRLAKRDPRKAQIVELRYLAGLTGVEIAQHLGVSPPTVQREWRRARTWLYSELHREGFGRGSRHA